MEKTYIMIKDVAGQEYWKELPEKDETPEEIDNFWEELEDRGIDCFEWFIIRK